MTEPQLCTGFPPQAVSGVFLRPGEWHFSTGSVQVRTTLGSCIAISFWHPGLHYGGLCHYMLPRRLDAKPVADLDGRYAEDALALLAKAANQAGTRLREYQVKIFGGADMFHFPRGGLRSVATLNIAAADQLVKQYNLTLHARDVGGSVYRQLIFSTISGTVWMRCGADGCPKRPSVGSKG